MSLTVALITNIAPHYREPVWLKLVESKDFKFHFFFGKATKNSIKEISFEKGVWNKNKSRLHRIGNRKIADRLIWQSEVVNECWKKEWDAFIFLGDINIVSNWLGALIAKLRGIPVLFWGHGMYGDEKGLKKFLRKRFLSLADLNLVYGHWAKKQMIKGGLKESKIEVIYNSLDYEKSISFREEVIEENYFLKKSIFSKKNPVLIFVGRLTPQKRIDLLINSVKELKTQGQELNLLIVGDGIERQSLESMAKEIDEIQFYGSCYDEKILAKLIANADLCVSPGNVGLTAIHSLSYGTPVCTHDNFFKQMPEFEAIIPGKTGCFFDWQEQDLSDVIIEWLEKEKDREKVRKNCFQVIDEYYNPGKQLKILHSCINQLLAKTTFND